MFDLNGKLQKNFEAHRSLISSIALSPNGKLILTGSWDNTARLWDLDGNLKMKFEDQHREPISSVAFSPNGIWVLTGSYDNTACMWDLDGNLKWRFEGHKGPVRSVAFSPACDDLMGGPTILTGSSDSTARLWAWWNGKMIKEFKGHHDAILSVAFSTDEKTILTGSADGTIREWALFQEQSLSDEILTHCKWQDPMSLSDFLKTDKIDRLTVEQKKQYGIKESAGSLAGKQKSIKKTYH